ncbi:MAG: WYL domain-containing protein, partial [Caldilineaceae bacterium]|nr:WYL domain-containing protein [Caldilineaceae bacterium]
MFGEDEAKALFLAVAMLTGLTTTGATHRAAKSALDKIRVILPKNTLAEIETLQAVLGFYHVGRPPLDLDDPLFIQIQQAIREQRVIHLHYHAQRDNQVTERVVEPLQLAYLDNVWVLSAYCRLRQDQRAFRLDRIDHLRLTRETFTARPVRERREASGQEVTIRVDADSVRWVRENQHFSFV